MGEEEQGESNAEVVGEAKASENPLKEWRLSVGEGGAETGATVSYTHLTLPTKRIV